MPGKRIGSVCATGLALALTSHAYGQAPAHSEATAATAETETPEIVVTARRRAELLQDVPQSITAFSGAQLSTGNVTRVDDLARIAPGFVVQPSPLGSQALTVTLRSQRQNLPNLTYDPSVVIYFAEVPEVRAMGGNGALYDLSSVQVLKGPQGTLFGRNSTGGALLITPQAPTSTLGGYAKAGVGTYGAYEFEGALNLPVTDDLQVRVATRHSQHDGYNHVLNQNYSVDDDNIDGVRATVRYAPASGFTNTLLFDYLKETGSGTGYKLASCNPAGFANLLYGICNDYTATLSQPYHTTASNIARDGTNIDVYHLSNITTADVSGATLKNIAGYRNLDSRIAFDLDGSSKDALSATDHMKARQISDEVQILGHGFDNRLDYILGAFFFDESGHERQQTPTLGTLSDTRSAVTNRSYAVFGQITYALPWLKGVSLTGGLRETWDSRALIAQNYRGGTCRILTADVGGVPITPCEKAVQADFSALTYNLSADWKITRKLLVYVATRRGYRAGGFVNAAALPSEFTPYRPETVTDYEIGLKSEYKVGTMAGRTNIALYTGNYNDIQRNVTDNIQDPTTGGFFTRSTIVNAAKARISGIEVEQMFRPIPVLEANVSYAYSNAKYDRFVLTNGQDYTASPFGGAPKHTLSGSVRLDLPFDQTAGDISTQVSGSYRSSSVYADVSSFNPATQTVYPTSVLPAYTTFDARIDWQKIFGTGLSAAVYVRNFTDKHYAVGGQDVTQLGFSSIILGQPRLFGGELRYAF